MGNYRRLECRFRDIFEAGDRDTNVPTVTNARRTNLGVSFARNRRSVCSRSKNETSHVFHEHARRLTRRLFSFGAHGEALEASLDFDRSYDSNRRGRIRRKTWIFGLDAKTIKELD